MEKAAPLRLAIVNDYEIVVAGVAGVLAPFRDRVDVVELDSRMPVEADVDIVLYDSFGQLQGDQIDVEGLVRGGSAKVVVFSWNTGTAEVDGALKAGAIAYISKGVTGEELVRLLERVHAGETLTPQTTSMPAGERFGRWPGEQEGLSPRESEILALICQGITNEDITQRIFISINTLKTHIRSIYRKIGASGRTQALLWGVEHGFKPDRIRHD